ncbi:transglycosylase SLT domain-containing protein [Salmonella enterica]|nr:transglycosylase SLT domain-containing protein [Salmonella enterica]
MRLSITALLFLMSTSVFAQDCFDRAGRDYGINADLLRAISFRESSWRSDALNIVSPESYAVGAMQIHSQNFAHLSQFGITPDKLTSDVCMNIYTGAYYLAIAFKRWGANWRAVGAYNAGFRETDKQEIKRQKYAREVKVIYEKIVRSRETLTRKPDS